MSFGIKRNSRQSPSPAEKSVRNLQNLVNLEMCKIDHWMHANKLPINSTKSQYMLVTNKKLIQITLKYLRTTLKLKEMNV